MKITKFNDPYPHLIIENVLPEKVYNSLRFPNLEKRQNTRSGWDLFKGEQAWSKLFSEVGWSDVKAKLNSQKFIEIILEQFSSELLNNGLDFSKQKLIDYDELGADQQCQTLKWTRIHNDEVFTRIDLQSSDGSTLRIPHVDHARRLVGGVFFLCDPVDGGIEGGDFGIWKDEEFANDRKPHKCVLVKTLPIKPNTMYLFLNNNKAFHAPTQMTKCVDARRWIYYSISSKYNFWRHSNEKSILTLKVEDFVRKFKYMLKNR